MEVKDKDTKIPLAVKIYENKISSMIAKKKN